ncbi:hypothetical protein B566_EDAN016950 [Ephemera danica]|nr:hypothetical protein B566_EDAN016950 [Ephemera danica]
MNNGEPSSSALVEVDERVTEELEALRAILLDEIEVIFNESGRPVTVETVLLPATAADEEQQFVTVTLAVDLPPTYPEDSPSIRLRNPRGLSDDLVAKILIEARAKCEDYVGQPVIYELIELVKEHLTSSNTPNCHCTICLYGFHDEDDFTKTPCFHYFHAHCLACYVRSCQESRKAEREKLPQWQRMQEKEVAMDDTSVPCPVCREVVSCELQRLAQAAPPHDVSAAHNFELTDELRSLQRRMSALYLKQQSKGGIIDPEAEDSKLLLVTQNPQAPGSRSWRTDRRPGQAPVVQHPAPLRESARSAPKAGSSNHQRHRGGGSRRDRRAAHTQPSCESTR